MLRDYQQKSIDMLYKWFGDNATGNPCLVMPTGSGKSHIIAALCKDAVQQWPETRVLMLTHVKELIEQNHEKMLQHWQDAPVGIYSASVGQRDLSKNITFAGIQSIRNRALECGHIDLVIIDECHLVSHNDEGGYRTLINRLMTINPALRVVGLTASPYRLGHGLITDKPAIFDALIEPVTIDEMVDAGYLAKLKSKATQLRLEVSGVKKRGGEYIESELQQCVDTESNNDAVVKEIIDFGINRRHWLIFCAGVDHAMHVKDKLVEWGISAECITSKTPKKERERIIRQYKAGEIIALTNANVLTTGFDYPEIDLIAMLRPTMSPGLYLQMAGRGLRIKSDGGDCYVLDFAGNVATHGAITDITPPKKAGKGDGDAPVRVCPECQEILHISVKTCPECGHVFPPPEPKKMVLRDDDIMGKSGIKMEVTDWRWNKHIGRASNVEMINVSYYSGLSSQVVREYICINHGGYVAQKAVQTIMTIAQHCGVDARKFTTMNDTISDICDVFNAAQPPAEIEYKKDGNFYKILGRSWRV